MNPDFMKWLGALAAGGAWFALVVMGKADAGTFIQFLQYALVGLGAHGLTAYGTTTAGAPAADQTAPGKPALFWKSPPPAAPVPPVSANQGGWATWLHTLILLAATGVLIAILAGCAAIPSPVVDAKKVSDDNVVENLRLMWCNLPIGAVLRHPEVQAYIVSACSPK